MVSPAAGSSDPSDRISLELSRVSSYVYPTVTALALFFSSYSSPMLSAIFTLGVYVAGQFTADLRHFNDIVDAPAAALVARAAYYVLPDFAKFDVKLAVVHGLPVSATYMASAALYGLFYIAALLFGAAAIFGRRDFK